MGGLADSVLAVYGSDRRVRIQFNVPVVPVPDHDFYTFTADRKK